MRASPSLSWALPEGVLLGAAVLLARLDAAHPALERYGLVFAGLVAAAALFLAVRHQRSRLAFAAAILAAAGAGLAVATGTAPESRVVFLAVAVLLPLNLAAVPWMLERGVTTPHGLAYLGFLGAQVLVVAAYAGSAPEAALALLDAQFLPPHVTRWTPIGDLGVVAFAIAGGTLLVSLAVTSGAARRPWAWALAACLLALHAERPGPVPTLYLATAGLMLVVATVEATFLLASHDGLTGLPARRALDDALLRLGDRYAIAMVDVDHFKQLNDTHGHDTGDQVLRMVATHLAGVRDGTAYRYGGEEFALVFPDRTADTALPELERLRREIEAAPFAARARLRPRRRPAKPRARRSAPHLAVTVSIGVADAGGRREPATVLTAADGALYRAKDAGRNRVVVAGSGERRAVRSRGTSTRAAPE